MKAYPACITATGGSIFGRLFSLALLGLAILPVCLLLLPDVAEVVYTLVSVTGLICLLYNGLSDDEYHKLFLVSLLPLLFFGVAALSIVVSGDYSAWFRPLKKLSELLATPFVALLLLRADIAPRYFILTAKISALLLFAAALYQFFVLHTPRPGGAISPLEFGHVALLLGYFSLIRLPLENIRQKLFSLSAFSAGFLTTLISQARIEWINTFFLMAALLFVWQRSGLLTKQIVWVVCGIAFSLLVFSVNTSIVHNKVGTALDQYHVFQNHQGWESSVGHRLIMWKTGLKAATKKPVFGWGIHRSQQAMVAELRDPQMKRALGEHHHLHNEYVNTLVAKGAVGLLSLLALLFVPMAVFYARSTNQDLLVFNASGILLCVSYAVFGMTYQAFGDDTMNIFFVIVLSYSLISIIGKPVGGQGMCSRPDCPRHSGAVTSEQ
ncbi:MAG: O-antigen ligase [Gammaproteobacteria bacterium]|nr:MAG: O-antigen ligase [Gammaproteobacteria bacterium]